MAVDKSLNDYELSAEIGRLLMEESTPQGLTEEGKARLEKIILQNADLAGTLGELRDPLELMAMLDQFARYNKNVPADWQQLQSQIRKTEINRIKTIRRLVVQLTGVAAAVVLLIGAYILLYQQHQSTPSIAKTAIDLSPGTNKAVLTLANGSRVTLDSAHSGLIAQQGKTNIINSSAGQLRYQESQGNSTAILLNTIATPKASQYQLVLSDGSHVWLNAGSSLTFPTTFQGPKREVQLQGEGYFEITRNVNSPFFVRTSNQEIQVLGTAFDVMAYNDEPSKTTTLVQGAVRITAVGHQPQTLTPGQQLQLDSAGVQRVLNGVDTDAITSWKDEIFNFNGTADLPAIMRQIGRWYNAPIIYKGSIPNYHLAAFVSRRTPVSKLLEMLSSTHMVSFEITINGIIVTNSNNSKQQH